MKNQSLDVPTDIRQLAEKTIDQAERAFSYFFQAAKLPFPPPGDVAIELAQRNIATSFEYARKFARAKDMQETIALQAEFLRIQIEHASEFMREITPKR
jgi:hypothetical protein